MPSLLKDYEKPDILATLEEGVPVVSPSQLNVYNRCAWSWDLRYVKGYNPLPTNDASEVGLLVHYLLQVGYESKKENPNKPYSFHREKVQEALLGFKNEFTSYEQMTQLKRAGQIVLRYFETMAPIHDENHMVQNVEGHYVVRFTTPSGNPYYIQGYIDLLNAMKGGSYRVEDHKSSPQKQRFYTPEQVQFDSQLKTYCIMLREIGYKVNDAAIRNYNTYDYKNGIADRPVEDLFLRTTAHYSDKELDTFKTEIGYLVDAMFYSPGIPIRRSISRDCASCWVKEACLYDMKGMSLDLLLKHKFVRKPLTETTIELIIGVDRSIKTG